MAAYERANIEVSVMHLFCDAHSAASNEKLKLQNDQLRRRMHCSARALKLTLARLHNARVARMTPMKFAMAFYSCEMYWRLSL